MFKKVMSYIGSLCIIALLVFSIVELYRDLGSWSSIDYIWSGAVVLFLIGFIGDFVQQRLKGEAEEQG
ncbi:pilus assembly protein TadC [Pullulanibacillus pueri]|uniref:Uncharacterized protein n=1 Tax=Pullulanibacillus pueri TaxID=1437324 RepID=A0A8J3EJP4_9BACL|nr:hypothetical protein [Pullulanibacillus pueri]MBM7680018.1 pilus assembly protein TadC [Pullulanibacillus pueri]GGH73961.1 hypothetical protein GCM10007096_01720 [Pullulanibacillus pueri]